MKNRLIYRIRGFFSLANNLNTCLSTHAGNILFIITASFPWRVIIKVRFLLRIPSTILTATSSAVIMLPSSILVSPCCAPEVSKAVFLILDAVKPGQATIVCKPVFKFSTLSDSINPFIANLEAEYPVLPGNPRQPAMDEIPTKEPLDDNNAGKAYLVQ